MNFILINIHTYSYSEVNNNIQYLKFCTCVENYWKYSLNSKTSLIDCIDKCLINTYLASAGLGEERSYATLLGPSKSPTLTTRGRWNSV